MGEFTRAPTASTDGVEADYGRLHFEDGLDGAPDTPGDLRLFPCPVEGCGKTFRRRFALKDHITSHTGEKPFPCPVEGCGRSFTTSGNLSRHGRIRHPWLSVPLDCLIDDCDCSFSSLAQLERHVAMVHFDASSHACVVRGCGRAFATAGNLRRHMRQQHDEEEGGEDHSGKINESMQVPPYRYDTA